MLYSYAGFIEKDKWSLIKRKPSNTSVTPQTSVLVSRHVKDKSIADPPQALANENRQSNPGDDSTVYHPYRSFQPVSSGIHLHQDGNDAVKSVSQNTNIAATPMPDEPKLEHTTRVKLNTMSNLSIVLTLISILVALRCVRLISALPQI